MLRWLWRIAAGNIELKQVPAFVRLLSQHGSRHFFEPLSAKQFQFASIHVYQAIVLEALQHPAHGFGREPQIVGDIGTRHRQLESIGRKAAGREPPRQSYQERRHALVGGIIAR